jgi:hypothetical protein
MLSTDATQITLSIASNLKMSIGANISNSDLIPDTINGCFPIVQSA